MKNPHRGFETNAFKCRITIDSKLSKTRIICGRNVLQKNGPNKNKNICKTLPILLGQPCKRHPGSQFSVFQRLWCDFKKNQLTILKFQKQKSEVILSFEQGFLLFFVKSQQKKILWKHYNIINSHLIYTFVGFIDGNKIFLRGIKLL